MINAELPLNRTSQYATYGLLCLISLIFIVILLPSATQDFRRFFGPIHPVLMLLVAAIVGAGSLWFLTTRFDFQLFLGKGTLDGLALSAALATALAFAIVIADFLIRYPEGMNVPLPRALFFYPAVGFIAEILFHVLPLAILLLALSPMAGRLEGGKLVWLAILLVALLEPTFQVLFPGEPIDWGLAYTWVHVFLIAALQLCVFRRFDFVAMYGFRLIYYGYWHILWGSLRLEVLF